MINKLDREERRFQRSSWASQALQYQLQEVALRFGLDRVVLADSLGHLWAASHLEQAPGDWVKDLAGMGLLCEGQGFSQGRHNGTSVLIRKLQVGRTNLFLAAQGTQRRGKTALDHAAHGVERILGALVTDANHPPC